MYEKNFNVSYLLDFYGEILTQKQKDAIDLYYNEDLSLSEIAEHVGITRQGVRDAIKRGEDTLLEMEEKLGFAKKTEESREAFEKISKCAENIKYYKNNMNYYKILDENVDAIINIVSNHMS